MAETVEGDHNASFWLPTHFLTDEDFLPGDDPTLKKEPMKTFDLFSNGFDPFGPPSALDSPVSSSETEPERDDHEELLAELTRQLAQSTLHESRYRSNPTHNTTTEKPWLFFYFSSIDPNRVRAVVEPERAVQQRKPERPVSGSVAAADATGDEERRRLGALV